MSRLNIQSNLFLGSIELSKMNDFLDKDSFRKYIKANIKSPGFIKNQQELALCESILTDRILINQSISAINLDGEIISFNAKTKEVILPNDNIWKWLKISYVQTTKELGRVDINQNGVLSGDSTSFLSLLRGQPNFQSFVKLHGSLNNGEYAVLSVNSDTEAILLGDFQDEEGIEFSIYGTFTPGFVPDSNEAYPFRYDSVQLTLVNESVLNTPPSKTPGYEFFLLRCKRNGSEILVQDKRQEFYTSNYQEIFSSVDTLQNKVFGVESVQFHSFGDENFGTFTENTVKIGWGFRSNNFTFDSNQSLLTLNGGEGGRFKSTSDFTNGDFDGWKVYFSNGQFASIKQSTKTGSQINCVLDKMVVDNIIEPELPIINSTVTIVPDCENIELNLIPNQDDWSREKERRYVFPVSTGYAKVNVELFDLIPNSGNAYQLSYRYLSNKFATKWVLPLADSVGYYDESSFDNFGYLKLDEGDRNRKTTTVGDFGINFFVVPRQDNYSQFKNKIDLFDINYNLKEKRGVSDFVINNTVLSRNVVVGEAGSISLFRRASGGLQELLISDIYINIPVTDKDGNNVKEGTEFRFIFKNIQSYDGNFKIRIVQDFLSVPSISYTLVKELTQQEVVYANRSQTDGLVIDLYFFNGQWRSKNINDVYLSDWTNITITNANYETAGSSYFTWQCQRDSKANIVRLCGAIMRNSGSGSGITTVGNIPDGFRPLAKVAGVVVQDADTASTHLPCFIETNGDIKIVGAHGLNIPIEFSSISYRIS